MAILKLVRGMAMLLLGGCAILLVTLCYSLSLPRQHWERRLPATLPPHGGHHLALEAPAGGAGWPLLQAHSDYTGAGSPLMWERRGVSATELGIRVDLLDKTATSSLEGSSIVEPEHHFEGAGDGGGAREGGGGAREEGSLKDEESDVDTPSSDRQNPQRCLELVCLQYLSTEEHRDYRECEAKTRELAGMEETASMPAKCHFINGSGRGQIALASFPGSGNTWIRGMLESATGVCTGFAFCDVSMRVKGFAGESIASSAVLAVKTHAFSPSWEGEPDRAGTRRKLRFHSAIFVVRNPFQALVSEWNRIVANNFGKKTVTLDGHVKRAGSEYFGKFPKWDEFVRNSIYKWKTMVHSWAIVTHGSGSVTKHPVLIVKYEDLKLDPEVGLRKMLNFLKASFNAGELSRVVRSQDVRTFQRVPDWSSNILDHYTATQHKLVEDSVREISLQLSHRELTAMLSVDDYLTDTTLLTQATRS